MSSELPWKNNWEKTYRITIGTKKYASGSFIVQDGSAAPKDLSVSDDKTIPTNALFLSNIEEEGFDRRGFTFKFNSVSTLAEKASDTENTVLELWNPNTDIVELLNQDPCLIMVEAGYEQKVALEYTGDVVSVNYRTAGGDTIYTIKCSSGAVAMRNTIINIRYDETVSEKEVIIDMANRFQGSAVHLAGLEDLETVYKTGGRAFTGSLTTNFNKLIRKHNLSYVHTNGIIVISPRKLKGKDYDLFSKTNYILPSDALKNIVDTSKREDVGTVDVKSKLRMIQVNTFYLPVQIGQFVTVPEETFTEGFAGTYQVKAKRTILDSTNSGSWDVVLELQEV